MEGNRLFGGLIECRSERERLEVARPCPRAREVFCRTSEAHVDFFKRHLRAKTSSVPSSDVLVKYARGE